MATADDTTIINAHFKSYDDFSSRMVLLPNDDDECTGAKVGSHEVLDNVDEDSAKTDTDINNDSCEACMEDMIVKIVKEQSSNNIDIQVPVGYVLTEIINTTTKATILTDLKDIEYTDLLSFLRDASFPLSLVFIPPPINESLDNSDTTSCSESSDSPLEAEESFGDDNSITNTESNESTTQSSLASLNKEEAAEYAKKAASVLGGRLSTWGYQAATRAADAAKQVKELRDERQRRSNDEQQHQQNREEENGNKAVEDIGMDITTTKPEVVDEKKELDIPTVNVETEDATPPQKSSDDHIKPCFIFLQTPSGFDQLSNDDQDISDGSLTPINNSSVISVRLSKDKACPLGKNGYTFQWYRSNSAVVATSKDSKDTDNNKETITWSVLCGACYPAYQPSVSDVGHKLQCIIKLSTAQQICTIPQTISIEQSLFDTASTSLLGEGGDKSVTYGNLRGLEDLANYRLKVDVSSNDDFITSSSIFIAKMTTGDVSDHFNTPILHFKVEADPAKPKLFAVVCSTHGRIRLEAANRKTRESLILALGIANYKGKVSSLTNTTILFPSYEDDDITQGDNIALGQKRDESTHDSSYTKLLESKLAEMTRILQSKESSISKLQKNLAKSDATNKERSKQIETVKESERQLKDELADKCNTIDTMTKAQQDKQIDQDRTVKALNNEISVLQAGIGARDTKIESLSSQIEDLSQKSSAQSQQLSSIEQLKSDLTQTKEKFSTSQKVIERMKRTENELQNDLKKTEGLVMNLNDKFTAAK